MKKYRDTDFLHVSVKLRAIAQRRFVDKSTLLKIIDSHSVETACKVLEEKGFDFFVSETTSSFGIMENLEGVLTEDLRNSYKLVSSLTGNSVITYLLRVGYDFQNIKALIKAEMLRIFPDSMLVDCGNIPVNILKEAVSSRDKDILGSELFNVLNTAIKEFSLTGDPQRIDIVVDKAYFQHVISESEKSCFDFLSEYFKAKADFVNIMIFLRCRRMKKDLEFFLYALLPCYGILNTEKFWNCYTEPEKNFYDILKRTRYGKIFEKAFSEQDTLSVWESAISDYLSESVRRMNSVPFGPQVVAGFLLSKENEIMNIRIAMSSVVSDSASKIAKEKIKV